MNLESGKIKLEGSRVIGLKETDLNKLAEAQSKKESSFTPNPGVVTEPMIQDQPLVEVVPEIMDGVTPETPAETTVAPEIQAKAPTFVQPIAPEVTTEPEVKVETPVVEPNIFDIPVAEPTPVMETPQVAPAEPYQVPQANEEVQGGPTFEPNVILDTPQNFFEKVEEPANNTILTKETVENNRMESYGDPALIMLDNIKEIIESKNEMIKALNDKISVLEEQLKNANEARQISEAQRVAAETTLAQARSAETTNNGGPNLVYTQSTPVYPNQNYNQAA